MVTWPSAMAGSRGAGARLTKLAHFCNERGLPILPVLVVSKNTGFPSVRAKIYDQLGIGDEASIAAMQRRCFEHAWSENFQDR